MASVCHFLKGDGARCAAPPLREGDFCLMHSPEHAAEVAEGRRLGGLRRRREVAIGGAYDFDGLTSVPQVRRLLDVAAVDTLGLENSLGRSRTLGYLAQIALKALEVGELEARLAAIEEVLGPRIRERREQRGR